MKYKNLFDDKKRKNMKLLSFVFLFLTLACIVLTIVLRKNNAALALLLIADFTFFILMFLPLSWCAESAHARSLKAYVDAHADAPDVFVAAFSEYLKGGTKNLLKGPDFPRAAVGVNVDRKGENPNINFFFPAAVGQKNQFILNFYKDRIEYFYGDKGIEEQDIEEWIPVDNRDFTDVTEILSFVNSVYAAARR